MSFGFEAKNLNGTVTVSDINKVLVFYQRGIVNITSATTDRPGYGTITFSSPITTPEAPTLFVRYSSGNIASLAVYFTCLGSPGNWTGFRITSGAGGAVLQNHFLEWVACKYINSTGNDPLGMQVFDANGSPVFDTSQKLVKYSKFTKAWSFGGDEFFTTWTPLGITIDADDFINISGFDRGIIWFGTSRYSYAGIRLLSGGVRTCQFYVQTNNTGYILQQPSAAGNHFCIPICKFPPAIYTNT